MSKPQVNESISRKLTLIVSVTVWLAIMLGLLVTTVNDVVNTRLAAKHQMRMLAEVLAKNSVSAILFNDADAARETLSATDRNNLVTRVEITREGQQFASFSNSIQPPPSILDFFPALNDIRVDSPIELNGTNEGNVSVRAELSGELNSLLARWLGNLALMGAALAAGLMLLRKRITDVLGPIEKLVLVTREIIAHEEYSLRVEKTSNDELGELTDEFNQMLTQIELRDSQLRQNSEALAQTQDAISVRDEEMRCQYVNPAFTALFGYHLEEIKGTNLVLQAENPLEQELSQDEIYKIALENGVYRGEVYRRTKSGKIIPVALQISPVKEVNGKLKGYVTVYTDITEKKLAEEEIWRQANFDALTGLPNRNMFQERIHQEVKRSQRTGKPFALMFLDLDFFKEVNDTYGHDMGDRLLIETGQRLTNCLRISDVVGYAQNIARLGGDEFMIILNELKEAQNVDLIAQRILDKLAEPYELRGEQVYISASIGITMFPEDASDAETLIKNADQSMYHAKGKGRNSYSYFTRSMQIEAQRRRAMVSDLRTAIEQEQFRVVYQPIINLATQKIYKAEALVRWQHPQRGLVSPADFIPVAEETGLILEIGDWIFYQAANQLANWRNVLREDFQISINKSPVQFQSKINNYSSWFDYLEGIGLPGDSMVIEITEGLMLETDALVIEKLRAFRQAGVQIAVDDFGTGYSALAYLKKFDVDYIKIDQSFVRNLSIYSEDMVLCEAIIVMAHKLGLRVIAEGVETIEQRDLLTAIGCDYAQGYLFSRPLPADELETLIIAHNSQDHKKTTSESVALEGD